MAQRGVGGSAGTKRNPQPARAAAARLEAAVARAEAAAATTRVEAARAATAAMSRAAAAAMSLRGGGGGLAGINRNGQPAAAPAMPQRVVGVAAVRSGGIDHNLRQQLRLAANFRDLFQVPPPPPPPAVVADNAGSSSDIEDPPVDPPAVNNPARVAAAAPLTHAPGADLGAGGPWFDYFEARHGGRRRAPSEEEGEGSSRRRQKQAEDDEASSKAGAAASPEEIYEALKEIPDLARADLLRAYSKLIHDARQFRCLMALPNDMRKDWLLMEIGGNQ